MLFRSHMTKENGERIGSTLGEVISVDAPDGGRAWGTCIRVRVHIDITKPLCRGRMVRLGASDRQWVSFQYERLPIYCYWCGKLDHDEKDCRLWIQSKGSLSRDIQQYGPWLRASSDRLQKPQVVRVRGHDTQCDWGSAKSVSVQSNETIQGQNTVGPVVSMINQNPDISVNVEPAGLYAPQNLELPSIQKNSTLADFEAQIRDIDQELERKVLKESLSVEGFSVSLPLQSNVLGSKSNGTDVTPSCGPTQSGPLSEVDKVNSVFALGPGDVITEVLNPTRRTIRGKTKKQGSANSVHVKKVSQGTEKQLEISPGFKEVVMGDQKGDTKRKLDDTEITEEADTMVAKRAKLDDAVFLGKVFEEQFGSAEVAKQPRRTQ